MISKKYNRRQLIIITLCSFCIVILNYIFMNKEYALSNTLDEYAYVSMAAYFGGYNWNELTSLWSAYYSYGYSLLIMPFFVIFNNFLQVYYATMILNIVLLLLSFYLAITISKKIFEDIPDELIILACFSVTMYSSNLINTKWMWPEIPLLFLFWFVSYVMLKLTEKISVGKIIILLFALVYMYMVHQRALVICIAAGIYLVYLFLREETVLKKKALMMIIGAVVAGTLFFITIVVKNYIVENIYSNNTYLAGNNIGAVTNSFVSTFSIAGIKEFGKGFLGKAFYFIYGTIFVGMYGLWLGVKRTLTTARDFLICKNKSRSAQDMYIFFFISFIGMFLLSVIFMQGGGYERHDTLIYGRYMEMVYGPILLMGFYELHKYKNRLKKFLVITLMGVVATQAVSYVWTGITPYYKSMLCSAIVVYFFYYGILELNIIPWIIFAVRSLLFGIMQLLFKVFKKHKQLLSVITLLLCTSIWLYNSLKYSETAYNYQNQIYEQYSTYSDRINELEEVKNVYVLFSDNDLLDSKVTDIKKLQVLLFDKTIIPMNVKEFRMEKDSVYILRNGSEYYFKMNNRLDNSSVIEMDETWTMYYSSK